MLRVLTLSTLYPSAAAPRLGLFVERQTQGLAAEPGVEVQVVAPVGLPVWPLSLHPHYADRRRLPERETWRGLEIHRPTFRVWPRIGEARAGRDLADALRPVLARIRRDFPFDVIDAEYFWPDGPAAMHLARAFSCRFSVKARGSDILYWGRRPGISDQIVEAGRAADGLLAVSAALKADMAAIGIPEERIRVHHTGVDLDRFAPVDRAAAKRALGVEGPLLACAGALIERKGQEIAMAALASLPGATLALVGEGPDRRALEAAARRLGVAERVRFLGSLPPEMVAAWIAAADVAVQPSRAEGLANVWVEALACGTPVVTCEAGGAREAIDRPEAGRIVKREAGAIAAAVSELLAAPPEPSAVRAAAARFSWSRNAAELADHLRGLSAP